MWRAGDKRIGCEAGILRYIANDEETALEDGLGTDRDLHGCLSEAKPNLRLEPLPAVLNEVDGRYGCVADLSGKLHQAIESGLGSGVEHMIAAKGGEPVAFPPFVTRSRLVHG